MTVRNKDVVDGFRKSLQPCLSPAVESSGCVQVEEEEGDCPGKVTVRKVHPVQIREDTDICF